MGARGGETERIHVSNMSHALGGKMESEEKGGVSLKDDLGTKPGTPTNFFQLFSTH